MSDKIWFLKGCSIFDNLESADLQRLEQSSFVREFPSGETVYAPSDRADSLLVLAKGRVKVCYQAANGKSSILAFVDPGEPFGELAVVDPQQRGEFAETVQESTVVSIPRSLICDLMEQYPLLTLGITKLMGMRRRRIERRLKSLLFVSNRQKLTHLLLELMDQFGRQDEDGVNLGVRLTHQELANVIGSTRETVTLVLREMQEEGLLTVGRCRLRILEPKKLGEQAATLVMQPGSERFASATEPCTDN